MRWGLGVGLTTLPCKKKIVEKSPRNSAGFCEGGQGLSWAVEPRKEEERRWIWKGTVVPSQGSEVYNPKFRSRGDYAPRLVPKIKCFKSSDSSVGIATGLQAGRSGFRVRFPAGARNLSLHHRVQTSSRAHSAPIEWVPGALSLGVKRPRGEAEHSPPSSAEVKNAWSYNFTPQYAFMAWCLVKHRDTFTLPSPQIECYKPLQQNDECNENGIYLLGGRIKFTST
jgi:hypothetical protein